MSKKRICSGILSVLALAVACVIAGCNVQGSANAAWGVDTGGAGRGCTSGGWFCTTFGATWRWYSTTDPRWGGQDPDNIYIPNDMGKEYTHATTVRGCAAAGGFWRYAMVSNHDGEQHGVIGLWGNYYSAFNADYFYGWSGFGMHYRGPGTWGGGEDWGKVMDIYNDLHTKYPDQFPKSWQSDLAWFCAGPTKVKHTLTVNYIANQDCYGAGGGNIESVTIEADDNDKAWAEKKSYAGYTFNHWEGVDNDSGEVNLADDDRTVNVYYDSTVQNCDEDCISWVPTNYQKSNANEGWTDVVVGVVNQSASNDNGQWHHAGQGIGTLKSGEIWAKPTDRIQWKYCYFPGAQRTAYSTVTKDNYDPEPAVMNPTTNHLNNMQFMEAYPWSNTYHVETSNLKPSSENVSYDVSADNGNPNVDVGTMPGSKDEDANYPVQQRVQPPTTANLMETYDPGDTLTGRIWTVNGPTWAWRDEGKTHNQWQCNEKCSWVDGEWTCTHDMCSHAEDFYENDHNNDRKEDYAEVKVPYNFWNTANAQIRNNAENRVLYAGETVSLETAEVKIGKRQNTLTQGDQWSEEGYATEVDNGHERLFSFLAGPEGPQWNGTNDTDAYGFGPTEEGYQIWRMTGDANICDAVQFKNGRCNILEQRDGTLNELGDMNGSTDRLNMNAGDNVYNVYDEAAGNYYCVAAAVYPFTVRDDKELDANGDSAWLISKPSCRKIAKKPNFQVWGAGVFSAGDVSTLTAVKNNIKGVVEWHITQPNQDTRFGSWTEETLTVQGQVSETASGAATGYSGTYTGVSPWDGGPVGTATLGGWPQGANFCLRSPLSIANKDCPTSVGGFGEESLRATLVADREALNSRFTQSSEANKLEVRSYTGDSNIGNVAVGVGETKIIKVAGKATISQNITYPTGPFTKLTDVPKVIVYADSIEIGCDVTRIDAILLAQGTVNTCNSLSASPTIRVNEAMEATNNDPARQKQLVVNGAIVGGNIVLPRTFGDAAGNNSMAPAELVNYDSSIYLWANRQAEGASSGQFTESAIRELAPRY